MLNKNFFRKIIGNDCRGYSMIELMLASVVGSVILAGLYSSFTVVSKQYSRSAAFAEIQEGGIPVIRLIARDIRMAGYIIYDADINPSNGAITDAIDITDSGNACCDSIAIVGDNVTTGLRQRVSYYTLPRTNPDRNALYVDIESWNGASWDATSVDQSLVTDYVEDFQLEGSDNDSNGDPMLVDVLLVIRSKTMLDTDVAYENEAETIGNYDIDVNDGFRRDEFSATINIKNLRNSN